MLDDEQIAKICHEANRAYQDVVGDPSPDEPWYALKPWRIASAIAGVRLARSGATPAEMHEAWAANYYALGWQYGPVKDSEAKTHPALLPYDSLPAEQKTKDMLFLSIVRTFGE